MPRPSSIIDIDPDPVEFGSIELSKISTDPALLKGYTSFIEGAQKAGVTIEAGSYGAVKFFRPPNAAELAHQLQSAQSRWDMSKKYYEQLATVGDVEYNYHRDYAQEYAESEGLPFPPAVEPISDFHAVINSIDEVTA